MKQTWKTASPKKKYINRELSWLRFNMRVLEEAGNPRHPLLDRVNFLSISGSNLDEFYMVRVAGLKGQVASGLNVVSNDGLTPAQQLSKINALADKLMAGQQACWRRLLKEMKKEGLRVLEPGQVTLKEKDWLENFFLEEIFPVLTPLAVDPAHPFPFIPNLGFCLILSLKPKRAKAAMAVLLPIPHQVQRFIRLPGKKIRFISLENLIHLFLDRLFPAYRFVGHGVFRVIRDSDLEIEEEAQDLVRVFESALKRRRRGNVIRLKLNAGMPEDLKRMVIKEFNVGPESVVEVDGILGVNDVSQLIVSDRPDLLYKPYTPRYPERIKEFGGDIFAAIRAKDFIVHHPYESFDVVHKFLSQAAADPDVVAIKQTLYRAGSQSAVIRALIEAAEAGKSVTAQVELRARFEEEQNIKWARDLERAGVQVVYGFMDLKTHAKVSMIIRREKDKLVSYVHFGTGNYHPVKAKIYTDFSFFTDDPALTRDAAHVFNYLTGYVTPEKFEKISMSPHGIEARLTELIDNEIENVKNGKPGAIWAKMNSLADRKIIDKMYQASCAGVQIDLIVRGICCLRPGIPGMSDNIRVKSIVGRFLEHARVFCFGNGHSLPNKKALVFISSADWMARNFRHRVEVMVPIENPTVHEQVVGQVMAANLNDNLQSWLLQGDESYRRIQVEGEAFSAHQYFMTNPSLSGRGAALKKKAPARELYRAPAAKKD
ncbi:MAG: RNA degradosome polyphosphate kinase [Proteobacteria bacterium]|nr:RNA degradosome polyphosphate kinase [Pseudomonadota bacterium]